MTNNPGEPNLRDVGKHFKFYAVWAATGLIDAIFLLAWVYVQWQVGQFLGRYQLAGVDQFVLDAFRILLAFITVGPIAIEIFRHLYIMVIQASRSIDAA